MIVKKCSARLWIKKNLKPLYIFIFAFQLGTINVVYALGTQDVLSYHYGKRGAKSLNLLNYVKNTPPPTTAKYFDALSRNVWYLLSFPINSTCV